MKKNVLKLMVVAAMIASCSDDDSITQPIDQVDPPIEEVEGSVVLNEVAYLNNQVEIYNNSEVTVDLDEYFLCLAPGTYRQIGALETTGNVQLGAGEFLVVNYDMPNQVGGLGLYINNDDFTSAENIADFVQWGDSNTPRENVAVEAGLWTAGDFVPVFEDENNSIIYDGEGVGVTNWSETTSVTLGAENVLTMPIEMRRSIVFNEVQYGNRDLVELYNDGDVTIDLSEYWLCLGPGEYSRIGDLAPESGNIVLEAGAFVVVPFSMSDSEGLGLYSSQAFTNADAMLDFVQWGAAGAARENIAVEAGIWTAGDFVPTVRLDGFSIEYDGEGDASSDWTEEVNPSLGLANDAVSATTTFNVTITNAVNIYNVHTFTERTDDVGGSFGPGPLNNADYKYQIEFQAVPGTKFTPVTMMGNSNDWFLAPEDFAGIPLWENGAPITGNIADQLILFDLGVEADNVPAAFPPGGANFGDADPDTSARIVDRQGRNGATYITAELEYTPSADGLSAGTFTFTIRPVAAMLPDPAVGPSSDNGFVATPGIVVLHELPNPLFTLGEEDRGQGLEAIAEDGMPGELFDYFTEQGDSGFLRLSSTRTVFSPGLVYAFNSSRDPFVLQGEVNQEGNGLEELAEDGNNAVAVDFIGDLGLPVAASAETVNQGPGEQLTFTIEVPQGQDYKLGFATMFVDTNDWFIAYNNEGYPLWDENGTPASGFGAGARSYLYDAGTEIDNITGFGADQAPRQNMVPNTGAEDPNNIVRRVGPSDGTFLTDVQFGKGAYNNPAGVVYVGDPRGGFNVWRIEVTPQ